MVTGIIGLFRPARQSYEMRDNFSSGSLGRSIDVLVSRLRRKLDTSALLIDGHPMLPHGCRHLLQDITVDPIHEATDVKGGYAAFLKHRPDVVIVDLTLSGGRPWRIIADSTHHIERSEGADSRSQHA